MLSLTMFLPTVVASLMMGTGIYDATGPITETLMMGMANPAQYARGLHQRLRSRALAAYDTDTGKRFMFVSLDAGMSGYVLTKRVVEALETRLPGMYSVENLALSGTHTHSGPSGFLQDIIFQFAGSGWVPATIDAMVQGTVESIVMAHKNLQPASGSLNIGQVLDASINRSPTSYLANPAEERAKYDYDTDKNMTLLKLTADSGEEIGMFNWFAVHPTSMNNTNHLVSGDNKGYASYLFEQYKNGDTTTGVPPGMGKFVGAFCSTNLGDVSPNTLGPKCRDTGLPCDAMTSTCNGRSEQCSAFGPGKDMFESTQIIGKKQFDVAKELYEAPGTPLKTEMGIDYAHTFVQMPGLAVSDPSGKPVGNLCSAAMGDSFAAGTIDGPGQFNFVQGNASNPFWNDIASVLHHSTAEEKACQAPKSILLATGSIKIPHPWAPDVLPVQILRLGQLVILVVPTEVTTMAGRRMRDALKKKLVDKKVVGEDGVVVIAGLANNYADYTTTFEEYQRQRYEAGSTIYGPHQLNGYIQELSKLVDYMANGTKAPSGPEPVDFSQKLKLNTSLTSDELPDGAKAYGQVLVDAKASYKGGDIAAVTFAGANPLNNMQWQGSFFEIQRCATSKSPCPAWDTIAVDGDWETRLFIASHILSKEKRTWEVSWYIPTATAAGSYRIFFRGTQYHKPLIGEETFTPFTGVSSVFQVTK